MRWLAALFVLVSVSFAAAPSAAQQPPEDPAATAADPQEDRASAFRAVRGPDAEQVPGGALLIGAYGAVFLLMLAYLWRLGRLHAANAEQLERLAQTLEAARGDAEGEG